MTADLWSVPTSSAQVANQAPAAQTIALDVNTFRTGAPAGTTLVALDETSALPLESIRGPLSGSSARSVDHGYEFLFQRFHVITEDFPVTTYRRDLDLGNVLSVQQRPGTLWNAFNDQTVTVTAVIVNVPSVTLSGLSLPRVIAPLSHATFLLSVDATGSPTISGTIDFVTSVGTIVVNVIGRRVVEFPVIPQQPVGEALLFQTDIIDSEDGGEQRVASREVPAQLITFNVRGMDDPISEVHNLLFDWMARIFGVPIYWEQETLAAPLATGATSIPIDTAFADYYVGGLGFIIDDDAEAHEIFEVGAINPTSLDPVLALNSSYKVGARVCPARLCYLDNRVEERGWPIKLQEPVLNFLSIDNHPIEMVPFDETHNSIPVFGDLNVMESRTYVEAWTNNFSRTTFGKRPFQHARHDRATMVHPKQWLATSKEEVWKVRSWLHQLKGPQGVFYLPRFRSDFAVVSAIGAADTTVDVRNRGFATFVAHRAPWNAVQIEAADGTVFRRNIIGSSVVDEQTEQIEIDSALGVELQVEDVGRIGILQLSRLGEDVVRLRHDQVGQAIITTSAMGVRQ